MKMRVSLLVAATLTATTVPLAAQQANVASVAWLAGCWRAESGASVVDEQWMAPRAGLMLGMSRALRGERVSSYEALRLQERDGRLVYTAAPSGQATTAFTSTAVSDAEVVFENPEHDFPQRIVYTLVGADSLRARVEAEADGQVRGFTLAYARVECS
jgi:hypothetical protein